MSDDGFRPLTIFIILRLVPNGRALRAPEPSCYKGMNVNVIVRVVIVQNFPPVSGNQSQPGENNYKPTMDIAVCLIDSCQDSHLTLKTKHSSRCLRSPNMNIEHLSPPIIGHPQPPPHPCGQEASDRKSALLQYK